MHSPFRTPSQRNVTILQYLGQVREFSSKYCALNSSSLIIGGQPPFRLVILSVGPLFSHPIYISQSIIQPQQRLRNISIPSSAFQDNAGSFTTQLTAAKDERILLSMSDATGETAGGITEFLTVGPSANGNQCDTSKLGEFFSSARLEFILKGRLVPDFFFSLDSDLEECR